MKMKKKGKRREGRATRSRERDSRRASPAARRRTRNDLRTWDDDLLGSLPDGILVIGTAGEIVSLNVAAEEMTGLSGAVVRGKRCDEVFADNGFLLELLRKTVETGRTHTDFDRVLRRPDGGSVAVSTVTSIISDTAGATRGVVIVVRDVSRIRELEEKLAQSDRLAALGTLAANVAHEIRNPLAGIRGAAQLLGEEAGGGETVREHTGVIIREVDRLSDLVKTLLSFASPRRPLLISCSVNQIVEESVALQERLLKEQGVTCLRLYDPQLPPVLADPSEIRQVLLNLVRNGVEAMPGAGTLTLRTRFEGNFSKCAGRPVAVIEVADTGKGIPADILPHLFDPFFSTKEGGTGLGLAISLRIAEDHGGVIEVKSEEGKGSTFALYLPLAGREGTASGERQEVPGLQTGGEQ